LLFQVLLLVLSEILLILVEICLLLVVVRIVVVLGRVILGKISRWRAFDGCVEAGWLVV